MSNHSSLADFIWKNADDLWGDFKHVEFGKIILPFTLLRRLECVLEPTRATVLQTVQSMGNSGIDLDLVLRTTTKFPFYNTSQYALESLGLVELVCCEYRLPISTVMRFCFLY